LVQIWIFWQHMRGNSLPNCCCAFTLAAITAVFDKYAKWNFNATKSCGGHIRTV
jgi:hypothetical protein